MKSLAVPGTVMLTGLEAMEVPVPYVAGDVDWSWIAGAGLAHGKDRAHAGEACGDGSAGPRSNVNGIGGLIVQRKAGDDIALGIVNGGSHILLHALGYGSGGASICQRHGDGGRRADGEVSGRRTGVGDGCGNNSRARLLRGDLVRGLVNGGNRGGAAGECGKARSSWCRGTPCTTEWTMEAAAHPGRQGAGEAGRGAAGNGGGCAEQNLLPVLAIAGL